MFKTAVLCVLVVGALSQKTLGNFIRTPSFSKGKRLLYEIEAPWATTIYCSCRYEVARNLIPETAAQNNCGVVPRPDISAAGKARYFRVEAEHVVPATILCGKAEGWTTSPSECVEKKIAPGRTCAERFFPCKYAISDVHNLFPASGGINGDRSDKPFTNDFPNPTGQYGPCPISVGFNPNPDAVTVTGCVQGLVARVSLYMYDAYTKRELAVDFTPDQIALYKQWMCKWPTSQYECERNEIANSKQGNYNHITKLACDNGGYHPSCPSRRSSGNSSSFNATNCGIYNRRRSTSSPTPAEAPTIFTDDVFFPTPAGAPTIVTTEVSPTSAQGGGVPTIATPPTYPAKVSSSSMIRPDALSSLYVLVACLCLLPLY